MTTLDPEDGYLVLINTFEVKPENADRLLWVLQEASGQIGRLEGFVSANLHVSEDRTRVVNYAQWRSRADYGAMQGNPDALPHMEEAAGLADSFDPVFYDLRFVEGKPTS